MQSFLGAPLTSAAKADAHPAVAAALSSCRRAFWTIALFSALVNMLMLTGSLYMLQVYDRVLSSRARRRCWRSPCWSRALRVMGVLDYVRGRVVAPRIGALHQTRLDAKVFEAGLAARCCRASAARPVGPARSRGGAALHGLAGALRDLRHALDAVLHHRDLQLPSLARLARDRRQAAPHRRHLANQMMTKRSRPKRRRWRRHADGFAETIRQQGEMIQALGMRRAVLARWQPNAQPGAARRPEPRRRRRRPVLDDLEDPALLPAVGDARPRRLRGAAGRDDAPAR